MGWVGSVDGAIVLWLIRLARSCPLAIVSMCECIQNDLYPCSINLPSEEMVMVMVTVMPRFVGFWPVKSASLVVSEEMVRCYEIRCYILLYFGDLLYLWECIVARIRENESPRLLPTYIYS